MLSTVSAEELPPFSTASRRHLSIDPRFNGPDGMGNGGYVSGALAEVLGGPADVMLRAPAPLGRKLVLSPNGDGIELRDGATTIATAAPKTTDIEPPVRPTIAEARRAEAYFRGHELHPFPSCFVCGTLRREGDGLRIFPGRLSDRRGIVTGLWTPTASMADDDGNAFSRFIWGALDCPGAWGFFDQHGPIKAVLGKIVGQQDAPVPAEKPSIVVGWGIGHQGRKVFTGSAVLDAQGRVLARAEAIWIRIDK